jgi:phage gp29-like protein
MPLFERLRATLRRWFGAGPVPSAPLLALPEASERHIYDPVDASAALQVSELRALSPRQDGDAQIAPYPLIDRYPTVLGANLSLQTISSVFRSAQTGWRQLYVDVLDELLEREPAGFAVLSQRILAVTGGRLEFTPPPAAAEEGSADAKRALEIASFVEAAFDGISDLSQSLAMLQWGGLYYGAGGCEIGWVRDGADFLPRKLSFIHSRRIGWPDPLSWSVHIWDQGAVGTKDDAPTARMWGIKPEDYPGKFVMHMPSIRGDYPTRDGLGRELAYWFALKGMAARGGSQWIERFGKPWVVNTYSTSSTGVPRTASSGDISAADAAARAMGIGSLSGATLPDSIKVELMGPGLQTAGRKLAQRDWAEFCDAQITKAVLWVTDTTEPGATGSRAAVSVRADISKLAFRFDADTLAATLQRDLVDWIVKLNFPGEEHLTPRLGIHVEEKPDPMQVIEVASKAAAAGMPVDADELAERIGLALVPQDGAAPDADGKKTKAKPRRLAPLKPVDISQIDPSIKPLTPPMSKAPPGAEDKADGETDTKADPADDAKVEARDFAERNACFMADLRDARANGLEVDQAVVNQLAARHGVPALALIDSTKSRTH